MTHRNSSDGSIRLIGRNSLNRDKYGCDNFRIQVGFCFGVIDKVACILTHNDGSVGAGIRSIGRNILMGTRGFHEGWQCWFIVHREFNPICDILLPMLRHAIFVKRQSETNEAAPKYGSVFELVKGGLAA